MIDLAHESGKDFAWTNFNEGSSKFCRALSQEMVRPGRHIDRFRASRE
jgi:hypothetical protein